MPHKSGKKGPGYKQAVKVELQGPPPYKKGKKGKGK